MIDPTISTALYLFSSFVQADAAILSIGAIFVIYRLQTLSSAYDTALLATRSVAFSGAGESILRLATSKSNPEKAAILLQYFDSNNSQYVASIAHTSAWKKRVVVQSLSLFLFVAFHCSLSSILLLSMPVFQIADSRVLVFCMTGTVALFVILVFFVTIKVFRMLRTDFLLEGQFFPDVFVSLPVTFDELKPLIPDDQFARMYQFEIEHQKFYLVIYRHEQGLFSLNFITSLDQENRLLSQKAFNRKTESELREIWAAFVKKPKDYLHQSR